MFACFGKANSKNHSLTSPYFPDIGFVFLFITNYSGYCVQNKICDHISVTSGFAL